MNHLAVYQELATAWLGALGRASWEGALALLFAMAFCGLLPRLSGDLRCWVWRLALLKLLLALCIWRPVELPLLKPQPERSMPARAGATEAPVASWRRDAPTSAATRAASAAAPSPTPAATPVSASAAWPLWLCLLWSAGVMTCGTRMALQWGVLSRCRREGAAANEPRLSALMAKSCGQHRLRAPALLLHPALGPLLLSGWKPAIVLPAGLVERASDAELEMILAHELAHLKRRDLFWNALLSLAQALFFFHPLVWIARRHYRIAQEAACDEATVRATGASAREYAELLLKVAAGARGLGSITGAVGVLGSGISLDRRLTLLKALGTRSRRQTVWAGAVVAAAAIGGLAPWRVVAQTTPDQAVAAPGAKGVAGEGAIAWEDMLLLQATRYLRLSPSQLQQMRTLARTADGQLTALQTREDKNLESLRRIATKQRDALAAGRQASLQEQADAIALRENTRRHRLETEENILNGAVAGLARVLSPAQVERAFLLDQGLTPEGEAREPALLDPEAGFVTNGFGGGPKVAGRGGIIGPGRGGVAFGGPMGGAPSLAQQLMAKQAQLSALNQHLSMPLPEGGAGAVGIFALRKDGDAAPKVFAFGGPPPPDGPAGPPKVFAFGGGVGAPGEPGQGPRPIDTATFREHLSQQAQSLTQEVGGLRRQLFNGGAVEGPADYEALLRPLARRLFLSPRLSGALEKRIGAGG